MPVPGTWDLCTTSTGIAGTSTPYFDQVYKNIHYIKILKYILRIIKNGNWEKQFRSGIVYFSPSNTPMMRKEPTPIEGWVTHRISSFFSPWSRATTRSVGGGGLTLAAESHFDLIWILFILFLFFTYSLPLNFIIILFFQNRVGPEHNSDPVQTSLVNPFQHGRVTEKENRK